MRSLFGRIFLWFCATVFCGIVLTHIVGPYMERPREMERIQEEIRHINTLAGTALVDLYERQGTEALRRQLDRKQSLIDMYIYTKDDGAELTGRVLPKDYAGLLTRTDFPGQRSRPHPGPPLGPPGAPGPPGFRPEILLLTSTSGATYRMVLVPSAHPSRRQFLRDRLTDVRLHLFLAAGVVFSFLLARSLTAPLRRLRSTVKSLGHGDLTSRTGGGSRWDHKEIGDLAREFDRMAERVETIMNSHKRLLRDISHELRSPLTRINVALDLARQRCGDSAGASLNTIATDAARMESLIDQMLTLSRLDAHDEQLPRDVVGLGALVMQVVRDADIEAHGRDVHIQACKVDPALVYGSEEMLRRAVENIIRNALAHSPAGSEVEVGLELREVDGASTARLRVRDNGAGVPEGELESIFEPYYRTGGQGTGKGNMGLGLAITRRAVRMHGGTVTAVNTEGGGLSVTITLPALTSRETVLSR